MTVSGDHSFNECHQAFSALCYIFHSLAPTSDSEHLWEAVPYSTSTGNRVKVEIISK